MKTPSNCAFSYLTLVLFFFSSFGLLAQTVKRDRQVPAFTGIKVGGAFHVTINQGNGHALSIETDEEWHQYIETEVSNGVLRITMDKPDRKWKDDFKINVYVQLEELESLVVSGAADVKSGNTIKTNQLSLEVSGAGDLNLDLDAGSVNVEVSGAGDLNLAGKTKDQKVVLTGAGDYDASGLVSQNTWVKASGAGSASVHAAEEIDARASGASSVRYYGDPGKVSVHSSGAGTIRKK